MASLDIMIEDAELPRARSGVVAELDFLGDTEADASRSATPSGEKLRRKVSVLPSSARLVEDLRPGVWEVRIIEPNGRVQSKEVSLEADEHGATSFDLSARRGPSATRRPVTISGGSSARKHFGRIGSDSIRSPGQTRRGAVAASTPLVRKPPAYAGVLTRDGAVLRSRSVRGDGAVRGSDAPRTDAFSIPWAASPSLVDVRAYWSDLAASLNEGDPPVALWGDVRPRRLSASTPNDLGMAWRVAAETGVRTFVLVQDGPVRRVHSVPVPWRMNGGGRLVSLAVRGGDARTSVTEVADEAFAGLIEYLRSGAVVTAVDFLVDVPELEGFTSADPVEALQRKQVSPLGACAAAYALIGTTRPGAEPHWRPWVANLHRLFDWLPDAAILKARLELMLARTEGEAKAVLPLVHDALRRGVPYYRQGFDWLLQAMLQFPDDDLVRRLQPRIVDVAAALDMTDVFTTFRIEGPR